MTTENETEVPKVAANGSGLAGLPSHTPQEALEAIKQQRIAWEEQQNPSTFTYYPYAPLVRGKTKLLAYTGTPVTVDRGAEVPANASVWRPGVCGDGMVPYFDDGAWHIGHDITVLTLDQMKGFALSAVTRAFEHTAASLVGTYSPAEQKSWGQQVTDAQAVLAGSAESPLLNALAKARGLDVKDLAQKIVDKAAAYATSYAEALATFQAARDAIDAATTVDDLPALSLDEVSVANYLAMALQ